jgi:hypothetical protein
MNLARNEKPAPDSSCQEPGDNWIPLDRALWFSSSDGLIPQAQWIDSQIARLKLLSAQLTRYPSPPNLRIGSSPEPKWSFCQRGGKVSIRAGGVETLISRSGSIFVLPSEFFELEEPAWSIHIVGLKWLHLVLDDQEWKNEVFESWRPAIDWHRWLLLRLVDSWREDFSVAVYTGVTRIMARKDLLAPFERITWDQWQYFAVDRYEDTVARRKGRGVQLRVAMFGEAPPTTATGPTGEKLYSIYIAPGIPLPAAGEQSAERKCQQWLLGLLRQHSDRLKPMKQLCDEAVREFGISGRAFQNCYLLAREQSGNHNWSKPGRPKISAKNVRNENLS